MRKINKKLLLFVPLYVLLSTGFSGVFFNKANATSVYDDMYKTTNDLFIGRNSGACNSSNAINIASNWTEILANQDYWYNDPDSTVYNQMQNAIHNNGSYVITNSSTSNLGYVNIYGGANPVSFNWNGWNSDAIYAQNFQFEIQISRISTQNGCETEVFAWLASGHEISARDSYQPSLPIRNFLAVNVNPNYPSGYAGVLVADGSTDRDNDGLSVVQELEQNTSDLKPDSDGDGISDLKESQWYADRDDVFCSASTPKNCAYPDPDVKDIFVEVDWMNDGSRDYKPTSSQLARVVSAYQDKGINAHFDTGQYGGGNELTAPTGDMYFISTDNEVDFYDVKNGTTTEDSHFSSTRKGVWRYMITSMNFMKYIDDSTQLPVPGTTGVAFPGDDDSMISIERVEELNPFDSSEPTSQDIAVAGTILHELGHNLCLSDTSSYPGQPTECQYDGIDSYTAHNDYNSVMNYAYQFDRVNYSNGTNGSPNDHDDWAAIYLGMNDFIESEFEWYNTQNQQRSSIISGNQLSRDEMINAIQD